MGIRANGQYFLGHFLFFLFSSSVLYFFVGHSSIASACANRDQVFLNVMDSYG